MLQDRLRLDQKPVLLVDGSSFLYRAFYAYPDLKTSKGFPTNAIFILLRILLKIVREERPEHMIFFMDGKGKNFRHELFSEYKANRQKMPEDLDVQIAPILDAVKYLGIPHRVPEGVEADDCIASLCERFKSIYPVVIVGSDKDLYQCLGDWVYLWDPGKKENGIVTAETVLKKQGMKPEQWPDYQALIGDSSDNIPGVPGIGPKTAAKILHTCPSLEDVREHFTRLGKAERKKLEPYLDEIFVYRELTGLKTDACPDLGLEDLRVVEQSDRELLEFFDAYELRSLAGEVSASGRAESGESSRPDPVRSRRISEPPDLAGENVGLVLTAAGFLLASGGREWLWTGEEGELTVVLGQCTTVFIPGYKRLLQRGEHWRGFFSELFFDLCLAAYLLDPEERDYSWSKLKQRFASEHGIHPDNEALVCLAAGQELKERLKAAGLFPLMRDLEMPLIPVLERMERRGVRIDLDSFHLFLNEVQQELEGLEDRIHSLAGQEFNVRSSQQLAEILFDRLGLPVRRKTPKGAPSTSSQVLEAMQEEHEIIGLVLRYRTLEKLRSTYLSPLPQKVDSHGRLHTNFNNMATATGRLSSSDPNLQNIPIKGEFGPRMRACFVAGEGNLLVGADYSQIELRVLAHMSEDPELVSAFSRGEDIHTRTAALLFDRDPDEVTRDERRKAKTVNFGLIYGMGPQKLSRELGISVNEAKEFISTYFRRLKKVGEFFSGVEEKVREKGYVLTIAGRRRLLPDINSRNQNLAQQARRMAVNTVIQGSAADIIKRAMLDADRDQSLREIGARLILQVHDELLLEIPEAEADRAGEVLAGIMGRAWDISVPLAVDWGAAPDWSRTHSG
ncbi:MAG: DNA polymerase I [Desulfonatronovibrionaceae bacterium]